MNSLPVATPLPRPNGQSIYVHPFYFQMPTHISKIEDMAPFDCSAFFQVCSCSRLPSVSGTDTLGALCHFIEDFSSLAIDFDTYNSYFVTNNNLIHNHRRAAQERDNRYGEGNIEPAYYRFIVTGNQAGIVFSAKKANLRDVLIAVRQAFLNNPPLLNQEGELVWSSYTQAYRHKLQEYIDYHTDYQEAALLLRCMDTHVTLKLVQSSPPLTHTREAEIHSSGSAVLVKYGYVMQLKKILQSYRGMTELLKHPSDGLLTMDEPTWEQLALFYTLHIGNAQSQRKKTVQSTWNFYGLEII